MKELPRENRRLLEKTLLSVIDFLKSEGLSEREIANFAGVSQSYINKMKNGKVNLDNIAGLFELTEKLPKPKVRFVVEITRE